MNKNERNTLLCVVLFMVFSLLNAWYLHWIPYSAPPVLLMLGLAAYLIWESKYGNKT